ncbi:Thymidylate synthase [Sphingobium sp. AntQ-1]|uniref:thymidylate synthase n=1 Tax=Sphingobium sp. AntQ-1 TaxID=2930091 RepID=UPI00234E4CE9|nr:thymidylate synthase [Sphingobium sp. AntQ-1]WCP13305.1 Thymidylate synthase [Sphingobium sp. AntQ-1]
MEIPGDGLDDILIELYQQLLKNGEANSSTIGNSVEFLGVTLRIAKPRARVSRSETRARPFSALGELLWYLSGSDEAAFVSPYIPFYGRKGKPSIVNGAYGPRIRTRHGFDQLEKVIEIMRRKDGSRRAVIQLYDAADLLTDLDIPCTLGLQFHRRGSLLHMTAMMRSNDAYLGLPHDVFCFTMIQELVATELGLDLGEYTHMVGSMHLYESDRGKAEQYISEGYQRAAEMPPMPRSEPFAMIGELLAFERKARVNEEADPDAELGQNYWADLARLLQINFARDDNEIMDISARMRNNFYHSFIEDQRDRKSEAARRAAAKVNVEQA